MNGNELKELKQGQRVRLLVDLEGGQYKAGDTGYLNKGSWANAEWGVVFDRDADQDMITTNVQLETSPGNRVLVTHVVEPIESETDDDQSEFEPEYCYACGRAINPAAEDCPVCNADLRAIDRTADLSEDTQELQPLDQQFVEAAHEMELIKQLAVAQDALDKATEGNTVTFAGLIQLNEKRDSAVKALINFCRDRWLPDPVYAPIGGD